MFSLILSYVGHLCSTWSGVWLSVLPWHWGVVTTLRSTKHRQTRGFQCYRGTEVLLPPWDHRNTDKHVAFSVTVALRCCYHLEIIETQTNTWLSVLPWHWGVVTTLRSQKHRQTRGFQCYSGTEVLLPPWDHRNTNTWLSVLQWHWGVVTTLRSTKHRQTRGFQCYSGTEVLLPPWDQRNTDKHVVFWSGWSSFSLIRCMP